MVGQPVAHIFELMKDFLNNMGTTNAVLMGIILASMMCIDLGGPINKAAYAFTVGLLTTNTYMPMAATMAGGMVPALGWQLQPSLLEINLVLVKKMQVKLHLCLVYALFQKVQFHLQQKIQCALFQPVF